jgi:hypothetical protein
MLAAIPSRQHLEELISDQGDDGVIIRSVNQDADRVDNGDHIHSVSGMFSLNDNNISPNTDVSLETIEDADSPAIREHLRVINSNQPLNDHDVEFFGSAFPELFCYGVGSPNQLRPTNVSFELGLRHLLKLRDRRFAQHHCFPLVAFDMIARRKGNTMLSLRLKHIPEMVPQSLTVTKEQLVNLLRYNREKTRALKSGRQIPPLPSSLETGPVNMLKAVEHCARHSYGTNEERVAMGHKVEAYCLVSFLNISFFLYNFC